MDLEELRRPKFQSLFLRSKEDEKTAFCSLNQIKNSNNLLQTTDPQLLGKQIQNSCHGWLILHKKDDSNNHCYSLWNPLTFESISFPPLVSKPEQEFTWCYLTSPPPQQGKLILYDEKAHSFTFINIGDEGEIWKYQLIHPALVEDEVGEKGEWFEDPVMCNGILYCRIFRRTWNLAKIDVSNPNCISVDEFYKVKRPIDPETRSNCLYSCMLESCGELLLVCLPKDGPIHDRVIDVQVIRLDLSCMEWKEVESFEHRAFFLQPSHVSSFSCSAFGSEIKGNHLYFIQDQSLYSFNMDDETISVSFLYPNLETPIWVMPDLRNSKTESMELNYERHERKFDNCETTKHLAIKEEIVGVDLEKLYEDLLFRIGKRLILGDYTTFRALNKKCRLACPPIQWRSVALDDPEGYNHQVLPWLTFWKKTDGIHNIIDPWHGQCMSIADSTLKDVTMCHSRSGWCVMLGRGNSIFLWNALTKEIIPLPGLPYDCRHVVSCTLPPAVDMVFIICSMYGVCSIAYIGLEDDEWGWAEVFNWIDFKVGTDDNLVFYNGDFYLLGMEGNLGVLKAVEVGEGEGEVEGEMDWLRWDFQILDKLKMPCKSFHQRFLLEHDGALLSLFISLSGEWIQIFTLDLAEMVWVEIENLGNTTLFISRFSCFTMTSPKPEMENRIYLPRYRGKHMNVVYYSLNSRKLHTHDTEEVLGNFDNTTEQISFSWVRLL